MSDTPKLSLPLLQPAQAQKHVTVNEALSRLDALTQLKIQTVGTTNPPSIPAEGDVHSIGQGATEGWSGRDGSLAVFINGGWAFVTPAVGWRAWLATSGVAVTYDGVSWIEGAGAITANGAGFVHRSIELDHAVAAGSTSTLTGFLPADAIVYGITGRVIETIGGTATMDIGVAGSVNRYGSGIGTGAGSWARGLTGSPLAYYSATDLVLTAVNGAFDGSGTIRLAVHCAELTIPRT